MKVLQTWLRSVQQSPPTPYAWPGSWPGYPSELDAAARRSGLGRALVTTGEQWAAHHGLYNMVVRSNVVRPESHLFCEGIGYQRTATSHVYHKKV